MPCKQIIGLEKSTEFKYGKTEDNVEFVYATALNLPLKKKSIDVVVISALLKHIKTPDIMITEIFSTQKDNGLLLVCDPRPFVIKLGIIFKKFDRNWIFNLWSLEEYIFHFKQGGYEVVFTDYYMPILPLGPLFEKILKTLKLHFVFFHQIALFKKITF